MRIMAKLRRKAPANEASQRLDRAIRAWREAEPTRSELSDATRRRVIDEVGSARRQIGVRPQALLFVPARRLALAAALPVVALSVLIASWLWGPTGRLAPGAPTDVPRIEASKQAGDVVFVIANGGRPHRVSKSLRPNGLGAAEVITVTEGQFRDRLEADARLVFYRID